MDFFAVMVKGMKGWPNKPHNKTDIAEKEESWLSELREQIRRLAGLAASQTLYLTNTKKALSAGL